MNGTDSKINHLKLYICKVLCNWQFLWVIRLLVNSPNKRNLPFSMWRMNNSVYTSSSSFRLYTRSSCDNTIRVSVSSSCTEDASWKVHQLALPQSTAEGLEPALRRQKAFHSPLLPVELHKLWGKERETMQTGREKTGGEGQGVRRRLGLTWER